MESLEANNVKPNSHKLFYMSNVVSNAFFIHGGEGGVGSQHPASRTLYTEFIKPFEPRPSTFF